MRRPVTSARFSFYFWMAVAIALTAFIGFSYSFFFKHWTDAPPLPVAVHIHGLAGSSFMILFVAQATLVSRGRTDLHLRLGIGVVVLAILFFLSAFPAAFAMAHLRGESDYAIVRLALPFVAAPVFILLVVAAFFYRRRPEVHKRLMLLAAIEGVTPALGRLPYLHAYMPFSFFAIAGMFLFAVPIHDWWTERRIPAATIWGAGLVLVSLPGRVLLGLSDTWDSIARDLLGIF